MISPNVKEVVREKYGQDALRVTSGAGNPCSCDRSSALEGSCDPITSNLYDPAQEREVPVTALKASLGCGNPTALTELKPGEVVLDLGSGGGIDVLLSARRVGPTSDVVVRGRVPAEIKKNMELWVGCVAGALSDYEGAISTCIERKGGKIWGVMGKARMRRSGFAAATKRQRQTLVATSSWR